MRKERILVVDDVKENLQLIGSCLPGEDYHLYLAASGEQALQKFEEIRPDLVLMDVAMPGLDGLETTKQLKALPGGEAVPVIFLTARSGMDDVVKGFEAGGVDYVTKPFNQRELLVRIRTHLELKRSRELIVQKSNSLRELLHVLCHDLANPVSNAVSIGWVLREGKRTDTEPYFRLLIDSLENAMAIIDLNREMARIDATDPQIGCQPVDLTLCLDEARRIVQERFERKELKLEVQVPDGSMVFAERTSLINSVLANLLTNAVKFSYRGGQVAVRGVETDEDFVLEVVDRGMGMSEQQLEKLFAKDSASSRCGTEQEGGTGFGMPLVKKFMELYGGSVGVESRDEGRYPEEHGTRVRLSFRKAVPTEVGPEIPGGSESGGYRVNL